MGSRDERHRHNLVPLAALRSRELKSEKMEKPTIRYGLGDESSSKSTSGLFICAVCQADLAPSEGISVHAGSIFSMSSKRWQGPFLCADCRDKKDAMEGKRPSGVKVA